MNFDDPIVWLSFIGLASGFLSGFLGMGAGIIIVPLLHYYFTNLEGCDLQDSVLMAVNTSIAILLTTGLVNCYVQSTQGFEIAAKKMHFFIKLVLLSVVLGMIIKKSISVQYTELIIAALLCFYGCKILCDVFKQKTKEIVSVQANQPEEKVKFRDKVLFVFGCSISATTGMGIGKVVIPLLESVGNLDREHATYLSKKIGVITNVLLNIGIIILYIHYVNFLPFTVSGIYLPAFVVISLLAAPMIYVGNKVSLSLPTRLVDGIFGVYLLINMMIILLQLAGI